jgi:hypothetical protein
MRRQGLHDESLRQFPGSVLALEDVGDYFQYLGDWRRARAAYYEGMRLLAPLLCAGDSDLDVRDLFLTFSRKFAEAALQLDDAREAAAAQGLAVVVDPEEGMSWTDLRERTERMLAAVPKKTRRRSRSVTPGARAVRSNK